MDRRFTTRLHRATLAVLAALFSSSCYSGGPSASAPETKPAAGAAPPAQAVVPAPAAPAVSAASGAATPKAVLERFGAALRDGKKELISGLIDPSSPNGPVMARMFGNMMDLLVASRDLQKAVEEKYGPDIAQMAVGRIAGGNDPASNLRKLDEQLGKAEIQEEGDRATVTMPGENPSEHLELVKRAGAWHIAPPQVMQANADQLKSMDLVFSAFRSIYETAGKALQTEPDKDAFLKKLGELGPQALMQVMQAQQAASRPAIKFQPSGTTSPPPAGSASEPPKGE